MKPIRSKIGINNRIMEEMNTFNYLGYNLSCVGEKDLNKKM
jgi:hypothetical protein